VKACSKKAGNVKTVHLFIRILSTGFVFFFYSELLFWVRVRPEDSIGNWLSTWMAYSIIGTMVAVIAYWLSDWSPVEEFSAGRRPTLIVSGLFLLYFFFLTIPAQPLAALILWDCDGTGRSRRKARYQPPQ
jgi:hypothetical protein